MTQSTTGLVEIKGWLANSPAGPWSYRPDEYDDWGIVKCAPDEEGRKFVICQARGEPFDEGSLNQHRRDKTDPWEAPAKLIAAVPDMIELLSTQETTIAELVAALEKAEAKLAWIKGQADSAMTLAGMSDGAAEDLDVLSSIASDIAINAEMALEAIEQPLTKSRSAL